MRTRLYRYARFAIVALALTLMLSALPTAARAAGPTVTVIGSGVGACNGRPVPALVQGDSFDVVLSDFPIPAGAGVGILLNLPDGRQMNPTIALSAVAPAAFYGALQTPDFHAGPLINAAFTYLSATTWPTGCYTVTATQRASAGVASPAPFLTADTQFMLLPLSHSAQPGNLKLLVQAVGTSQPTGAQPRAFPGVAPLVVNIFGQGVPITADPAGVTIDIVHPGGAISRFVIPPNAPFDGSFNGTYAFDSLHSTGMYRVYATVNVPSAAAPLTYTAQAQFNLNAPSAAPAGNASLEMLDRFSTLVPRGTPVSIVGRRFNELSGVPVNLEVVIPGGARLFGGVAYVNPDGNFAVGPATLGNSYPIGTYTLIASQPAAPPFPARTATLTWRLIPQQP